MTFSNISPGNVSRSIFSTSLEILSLRFTIVNKYPKFDMDGLRWLNYLNRAKIINKQRIDFIINDLPGNLNVQVTCHENDELEVAKLG
ncbi:hypothetical protein DB44_BG00160 [Candidatus Protochlamydia amoebophila]|uniref:Uncharacterized protein n=1 Tax=Candidatus Protochlamydia amoebophila TaxID=362787 RepID=A0A0C1K1N9_9BACT|nr:hypothetical protein DB44_BG00160 [Candidatus Protochlamydia amoebophila]